MSPSDAQTVEMQTSLSSSERGDESSGHRILTGYASPRDFMEFEILSTKCHGLITAKLDAIYIPTRFIRLYKNQDFHQRIRKYAHNTILVTDVEDSLSLSSDDLTILRNFEVIGGSSISDHHNELLNKQSGNNPSQKFLSDYDLPAKRNLALAHAQSNHFEEIMLLDDDIVINDNAMCNAIGLLRETAPIVGFYVLDHPDVSTLDHIHRLTTGIPSKVSVAANCILLRRSDVTGFFPYTYNEDWLFIYAANANLRKVAAGIAYQHYHEPWLEDYRIEFEQFGDVVAEGIKSNLKAGLEPLDGSAEFWCEIIDRHRSFVDDLSMLPSISREHASAVQRAIGALSHIDAQSLFSFTQTYLKELQQRNYHNDCHPTA